MFQDLLIKFAFFFYNFNIHEINYFFPHIQLTKFVIIFFNHLCNFFFLQVIGEICNFFITNRWNSRFLFLWVTGEILFSLYDWWFTLVIFLFFAYINYKMLILWISVKNKFQILEEKKKCDFSRFEEKLHAWLRNFAAHVETEIKIQ